MSLPVCLTPTEEMRKFICEQFTEGKFGASRIAVKVGLKFKVRVPYSRVIAVLNEFGLHRTQAEAKAVMPPCKQRRGA
jgi:hypothetical protein